MSEFDEWASNGGLDVKKFPMSNIYKDTDTRVACAAWDFQQSKIDELQARIDEALTQVNNHKHSCEARKRLKHMSASVSEIAEIEAHESNMYVLENILKGSKDEN